MTEIRQSLKEIANDIEEIKEGGIQIDFSELISLAQQEEVSNESDDAHDSSES